MTEPRKYYTPIEFPELDEPEEEQVDTTDPLHDIDLTTQFTEIRRMVQAIQLGQSTIVSRALQLDTDKGPAPCMKALHNLIKYPSTQYLFTFLELAKQDVNLRFRRECVAILKEHPKLTEMLEGRDDA